MARSLVIDLGVVNRAVSGLAAAGALVGGRVPDYGSSVVVAGEDISSAVSAAEGVTRGRDQLSQFLAAGVAETARIDAGLAEALAGAVG